ncbi:hypothetical protein N0V84_012675 [Fusarium piperis]|uniref:Uncharacterized protein n=1 Tax=Fusarium piperis TaxID=1435070 RepID=A0A9W8TC33_9HYPO|nr:hypothetical protein N0V84_012675 [Fusarium piperis]
MAPNKPTDKGGKTAPAVDKSDQDCINIRRIPGDDPSRKCPDWHNETDYGVYQASVGALFHRDKGKRQRQTTWEKTNYPPGIYLPVALNATLNDSTLVTYYNGFKRESDYTSFVDGPLADLIGPMGRVMRDKFSAEQIKIQCENEGLG